MGLSICVYNKILYYNILLYIYIYSDSYHLINVHTYIIVNFTYYSILNFLLQQFKVTAKTILISKAYYYIVQEYLQKLNMCRINL